MKPNIILRWIVVINLVILSWLLFSSLPFWAIREVKVEGSEYVPVPIVLDKVQLSPQQSLWRLTPANFAILRSEPWVKAVKLQRQLPSTLIIKLTVRKPCYSVEMPDHTWLVDETGTILNQDTRLDFHQVDVPKIRGLHSIEEISQALAAIIPLHQALGDNSVQRLIFYYPDKNSIMIMFDTVKLKIGNVLHYQEKITAAQHILRSMGDRWRSIDYIDLRAYRTPAVHL